MGKMRLKSRAIVVGCLSVIWILMGCNMIKDGFMDGDQQGVKTDGKKGAEVSMITDEKESEWGYAEEVIQQIQQSIQNGKITSSQIRALKLMRKNGNISSAVGNYCLGLIYQVACWNEEEQPNMGYAKHYFLNASKEGYAASSQALANIYMKQGKCAVVGLAEASSESIQASYKECLRCYKEAKKFYELAELQGAAGMDGHVQEMQREMACLTEKLDNLDKLSVSQSLPKDTQKKPKKYNPHDELSTIELLEKAIRQKEVTKECLKSIKSLASNNNIECKIDGNYYLGLVYSADEPGKDIKKDVQKAIKRFKVASKYGHSISSYELGEIYRNQAQSVRSMGDSVKKFPDTSVNEVKYYECAKKYYELACKQGHKDVQQKIAEVDEQLARLRNGNQVKIAKKVPLLSFGVFKNGL